MAPFKRGWQTASATTRSAPAADGRCFRPPKTSRNGGRTGSPGCGSASGNTRPLASPAMAGDPAELAFGHALAMLGDPEAAAEVANTALRRAGRSRGLVLAHARQQAVARAAEDE